MPSGLCTGQQVDAEWVQGGGTAPWPPPAARVPPPLLSLPEGFGVRRFVGGCIPGPQGTLRSAGLQWRSACTSSHVTVPGDLACPRPGVTRKACHPLKAVPPSPPHLGNTAEPPSDPSVAGGSPEVTSVTAGFQLLWQ